MTTVASVLLYCSINSLPRAIITLCLGMLTYGLNLYEVILVLV